MMEFQDYAPRKRSRSPKRWRIGFLLIIILGSVFSWKAFVQSSEKEKNVLENSSSGKVMGVEDLADIMKASSEEKDVLNSHVISEGDVPADIFWEHGKWDANDTQALLLASEDVYDFTQLKIGRTLTFFFDGDEKASRMEYDRDTEEMVVVERSEDEFLVKKKPINYDVSEAQAAITIDSFLYADALKKDISPATIIELADVFAYAIDFTTEIRQGDQVKLIYEKRFRDGDPGPDGRILASKFTNEGKEHFAYYFESGGEGGYYDGEGHAIVRQFLKAPLSFSRITSGYTGARMHPITKTVSAHYQIDYAAPTGTPVVSTARGTVTSARYETGWGNIVRVTHDNGYTTHYGHLSAFAKGMTPGMRVDQGQLVGYVGSTGWSTGPHLDYGMRLNGAPINPLTLDQPKGPPLEGEAMESFMAMKEKYREKL